jgi:hypothetical protein
MAKSIVKKTESKKVVKKSPASKKGKEKDTATLKNRSQKIEKPSKTPAKKTPERIKKEVKKVVKVQEEKVHHSVGKKDVVSKLPATKSVVKGKASSTPLPAPKKIEGKDLKETRKKEEVPVKHIEKPSKNIPSVKHVPEKAVTKNPVLMKKTRPDLEEPKVKEEIKGKKIVNSPSPSKQPQSRKDHPLDQVLSKQLKKPLVRRELDDEENDDDFLKVKQDKNKKVTKSKDKISKKFDDDEIDDDLLDDDHDLGDDEVFDDEDDVTETKKKSEDDFEEEDDFEDKGRNASIEFEEITEGVIEEADDEDEDVVAESTMMMRARELGEKILEEISNLSEDYNLADIREAIRSIDFFGGSENDECLEKYCENLQTTMNFCRFHYIKNWKLIKKKQIILAEGKLQQYIEELIQKYPPKYIEIIMNDLSSEKQFYRVLKDLNIDTLFQYDDVAADLENDEDIVVETRTFSSSRNFDDEEII